MKKEKQEKNEIKAPAPPDLKEHFQPGLLINVRGIPADISLIDLKAYFAKFGKVRWADIIKPQNSAAIAKPEGLTTKETTVISKPDETTVISKPEDSIVISKPEDSIVISKPEDSIVISKPEDSIIISKPEDSTIRKPEFVSAVIRFQESGPAQIAITEIGEKKINNRWKHN